MKIEKHYLIFGFIMIIGVVLSGWAILTQSDAIYKNNEFVKIVEFEHSGVKGDTGYLLIQRNEKSPAIADNVAFSNGRNHIYFSSDKIQEKLYFDIPSLESGDYYVDVIVVFTSGKEKTKEIKFKVI